MKSSLIKLEVHTHQYPIIIAMAYMLIYAGLTACSIPGMFLLTMLGGKLFGFWTGLCLTALGATSGSLINFYLTRILFFETMRRRWTKRLSNLELFSPTSLMLWLLAMRLMPVIPYYFLNAMAALTRINGWRFYLATLVGMIPIHSIYALAGDKLAEIETIDDVLSPPILLSLIALALFGLTINALSYRLEWTSKQVKKDGD